MSRFQEEVEELDEFDAESLQDEMLEIDPERDLTFGYTNFDDYGDFDE